MKDLRVFTNDEFGEYKEKFKFMFDYLCEIDCQLAEQLSNFVQNGIGKPELLLEAAVIISFNRAYSSCAMLLLNTYEYYMFENKGYCFPYLLNSVRETIIRNMVSIETNSSNKCLYLLKMSNGTIKIGITTDIKRRISQIKSASGMHVEKCIYTDIFENAKKKESQLHNKYRNERKNGEYFATDFSVVEKEFIRISKEENAELHYM